MMQKIKSLRIIHFAICAGAIIAFIVIGQPSVDNLIADDIGSSQFSYILIPFAAIIFSNALFKMQLKKAADQTDIDDKLVTYNSASIIRWAVIEAGIFAILFLTPNFLLFGLLLIIYLVSIMPTEQRVKRELQLLS